MARQSVIKWKNEDTKNLRKAVSDFNKKVKKLKSTIKDDSFLPDEIDYKGTKELIKTRSELNRVLRSLGRFKGAESFKKVTLPSGEQLTNWEKKEIQYQKASAIRRIKKRMAEIKKPYFKMGNEEYRKLEAELQSIQGIFNKRGQQFERTLKAIENLGSSDYEIRKALQYKENYLKMFNQFENSPYYEAILKKLKSFENPITFYKKIQSLSYGEYVGDIKFMYDSKQANLILGQVAEELGIEAEDEEV